MSTLSPWLSLYLSGGIIWVLLFGAIFSLYHVSIYSESADTRLFARLLLATPVWPLVAAAGVLHASLIVLRAAFPSLNLNSPLTRQKKGVHK